MHRSTSRVWYTTVVGRCAVRQAVAAGSFFFSGAVFVAIFSYHLVLILSFPNDSAMGKKEEEEIIRIAKKMDKMAQKKSGVSAYSV